jgi:heme A synthase
MAEHILTRLNRRGFRLIMVLDLLVLNAVMYGTNLVRFGLTWPNSIEFFAASFFVATVVIFATMYFGGLYERTPRLGHTGSLPTVARLMLISGDGCASGNAELA